MAERMDLPGGCAELEALRSELDAVDAVLVDTLGRRFEICRRIARLKLARTIPMMQVDRISIVKRRVAALAETNCISAGFIEDLYDRIIGEACRVEQDVIDSHSG